MGDTIESIRTYDPATQRSTAALDQAAIAPLQELIASDDEDERTDRSATAFDYLWSGSAPLVLVSEPDEVRRAGREADAADRRQLRRGGGEGCRVRRRRRS